ncbi:MAG: ATP-binding protein, partial [Candidatus Hydrogenedentes bacterium]|nr:ATP-binding protein [Candidatus Hydrogenedentota bacterium]
VLQNAVDAAGEGGRVQIDAAQEAGHLEIRVSDDGPGMSPAERQLAGAPFYSTRDGHAGLGLVRARALAARVGGSVEIYSERGRGSVTVLSLPVC